MESEEARLALEQIMRQLDQIDEIMQNWEQLEALKAPRRNKQYRGKSRVSQPNNRAVGASIRELRKHILTLLPKAPPAPQRVTDESVNKSIGHLMNRMWREIPTTPYIVVPEEHEPVTYELKVSDGDKLFGVKDTFNKFNDTTGDYVTLAASEIWIKAVMSRIDRGQSELQKWAWEVNIPAEGIRAYILSLMPPDWATDPTEIMANAEAVARQAIEKGWEWYSMGVTRDSTVARRPYEQVADSSEEEARYNEMMRRMIEDEEW